MKKFSIDPENTKDICLMKVIAVVKKDPANSQKLITEFWSCSG